MDEIVKALRNCIFGDCADCDYRDNCADLARKAANAIEELSRRIDRAVELYNRNVEKTAMYEALAGTNPQPPKEE